MSCLCLVLWFETTQYISETTPSPLDYTAIKRVMVQMTYPETPVLVWERAVSREEGANLKGKEFALDSALKKKKEDLYIYVHHDLYHRRDLFAIKIAPGIKHGK